MIGKKTFWIGTTLVLTAGLAVGAIVGHELRHADRQISSAAWAEVFATPDGLIRGADTIVLAEAMGVQPGRMAVSEDGNDSLPFELWDFLVVRGLKGSGDYERIYVERAGGTDHEGHSVFLDADGGPFEIGKTYLLFLKEQPGGTAYYVVNHQGRYREVEGRLVSAAPHDQVAQQFHGHPVSAIAKSVEWRVREDEKRVR